jgi:hypothetical protein
MRAGRAFVALLAVALAGGALAAVLALGAAAPPRSGEVIYSNLPGRLGGLPSVAFESYSTAEFGGEVQFAGTARKNPTVTFVLASYACQNGRAASCRTNPGASFSWPLTLEVYQAGAGASVGSLITRVTRKFNIPYRPSARAGCPDEGWTQGFGAECSFAAIDKVSFPLAGTTLPSSAVLGLAFDTRDYGGNPRKRGGPYDLLGTVVDADYVCTVHKRGSGLCLPGGYRNLHAKPPSVGSNPLPSQVFINTTYEALVCGGAAGSFGSTGSCWRNEQPALEVRASN